MYKPPENSNRVKSIKSKFENIQAVANGKTPANEPRIKTENKFLCRQLSDPQTTNKCNIKRTPAFRLLDRNNVSKSPPISFQRDVLSNRSTHFENKLKQYNNKSPQKSSFDCDSSNFKQNNDTKRPLLIKSKSSHDFAYIRKKFDKNGSDNKVEKNVSHQLYTEPIPKLLRIPVCHSSSSNDSDNDNLDIHFTKTIKIGCEELPKDVPPTSDGSNFLTDTLKTALKRPLPAGPAPRKPPRTFEHKTPKKGEDEVDGPVKNESFLHLEKPENVIVKETTTTPNRKDPRYMLNKLETALRNNIMRKQQQQKLNKTNTMPFRKVQSNRFDTATSGEDDSDDSVLSKSKKNPTSMPLFHANNSTNSSSLNCLNGLTHCVTTMPYEKLNESTTTTSNSSFFVTCPPLNGKNKEEHVYAEPFKFPRNDLGNNCRNSNNNRNSLYYMSTALLEDDGKNCSSGNNIFTMDDLKQETAENGKNQMMASSHHHQQISAESSSLSSFTSDLESPSNEDDNLFEPKIKQLINAFECQNISSTNNECDSTHHFNDINNSIDKLKMNLQKELDHSFKSDAMINKQGNEIEDDDKIVNKFQSYSKTVPKYAKPNVQKTINNNNNNKEGNGDKLFDCCLIVLWNSDVPQITFKYPKNTIVPKRIEDLCFPEAASGPLDHSINAQCYSLVITNDKGEQTFGYCRRVIPEGSQQCIPLAYCILSKHRAPRFYKRILKELESRHGIANKLREELIAKFYNNPFPLPGQIIKIDLSDLVWNRNDENVELTLSLHHDTRYEEVGDLKPLHNLPVSILLKIFASLLFERKVILISCMIGHLSNCVDALQTLLYPFAWPHTFIPILPECWWDVVESPTPVICGILSVNVVNRHKIEHGIVVDLDENNVMCEEGDEDTILSTSMKKTWLQAIEFAKTLTCQEYVYSVYLSDAYMRVFIVALKHYKNHIQNGVFDKEGLIKNGKTRGIRRFLKWFTETSLFESFIELVLHNSDHFHLFDNRIKMYGSNQSNEILTKLIDWKK